jgi:hypothetical protein
MEVKKMTKDIERQVIELIAADRIYMAISSMDGKLYRQRPKLAKDLGLKSGESFEGERVYARVETGDTLKARGIRDGVEEFKTHYPRHGKILEGYIQEKRAQSETNVYFGVQSGCKLTQEDYLGVMKNLGLTNTESMNLYPALKNTSQKLAENRGKPERSVLIG